MIAWLQAVAVVWGFLAVVVAVAYAITWVILWAVGGPFVALSARYAKEGPQPVVLPLAVSGDGCEDPDAQDRPIQDRPPVGPAKGCRVYAQPTGGRCVYWGQVHPSQHVDTPTRTHPPGLY